jgi:hypothetical protein
MPLRDALLYVLHANSVRMIKTKFGREDKFKPTAGKDHIVYIHQTLEER